LHTGGDEFIENKQRLSSQACLLKEELNGEGADCSTNCSTKNKEQPFRPSRAESK